MTRTERLNLLLLEMEIEKVYEEKMERFLGYAEQAWDEEGEGCFADWVRSYVGTCFHTMSKFN